MVLVCRALVLVTAVFRGVAADCTPSILEGYYDAYCDWDECLEFQDEDSCESAPLPCVSLNSSALTGEFECRRACSEYTVPWLLNFSSSFAQEFSDLELELDSQVCDLDYCKWTGDSCEMDCYTKQIREHGVGGDAEACRALPDDDKCVWTGDVYDSPDDVLLPLCATECSEFTTDWCGAGLYCHNVRGICEAGCSQLEVVYGACQANDLCEVYEDSVCLTKCSSYEAAEYCDDATHFTGCRWNRWDGGFCEIGCFQYDKEGCDSDVWCKWDDYWDDFCRNACLYYTDEDACELYGCSWTGDSCVEGCGVNAYDACGLASECAWVDYYGTCLTACSEFTEDYCLGNGNYCHWTGESCITSCWQYDYDTCASDASCEWDDAWGCFMACSAYGEDACPISSCRLEGASCEAGCGDHAFDACGSDDACEWLGDYCYTACPEFAEDECYYYSNYCRWNGDACEAGCGPYDYDACGADDSCAWDDDWSYCADLPTEEEDDDDHDSCVDSTSWTFGSGGKGCARLYDKPELCRKKSADKVLGYEACRYACGLCDDAADSETWYANGKPSNSCDWIGKKPDARCKKKDDAKVEAWYACPTACGTDDDHTADSCLADFGDELEAAVC